MRWDCGLYSIQYWPHRCLVYSCRAEIAGAVHSPPAAPPPTAPTPLSTHSQHRATDSTSSASVSVSRMSATAADVVEYQVGDPRVCCGVEVESGLRARAALYYTPVWCSWCRPGRAASPARRSCRGFPSPGSSPSPRSPPGRSLASARRAAAAVLRYQPEINVW